MYVTCATRHLPSVCFSFLLFHNVLLRVEEESGHFSEACFDDELMTPYFDEGSPMSRLSIAVLADIGYIVDYSQEDPSFNVTALQEKSCCNPTGRRRDRRNLRNGNIHPLDFEFFNDGEPGQNQSKGKRPPLSEIGRGKAKAYGLEELRKAKLPPGVPREQPNGVKYVGDLYVNVLYQENGHLYDVTVVAE